MKQFECAPCITAKLRRRTISNSTRKTIRLPELVHLDVSGKVKESLQG